VRELLARWADEGMNYRRADDYDRDGSPLIVRATSSDEDPQTTIAIMEMLFAAGASVFDTDSDGRNALSHACCLQKVALVSFLISRDTSERQESVNNEDKNEQTTMHYALMSRIYAGILYDGDYDPSATVAIVEALLASRAGRYVAWHANKSGLSPLMLASTFGDVGVVEVLLRGDWTLNPDSGLRHGDFIDWESIDDAMRIGPTAGQTALDIAREKGHMEIVEMLLAVGALSGADPAWRERLHRLFGIDAYRHGLPRRNM